MVQQGMPPGPCTQLAPSSPSTSQAAANEVSSAANEIVENMRVVKLFAQQHRELTRFRGLLESAHQLALKVRVQWAGDWAKLCVGSLAAGLNCALRVFQAAVDLQHVLPSHATQVLRLQALLDASSRVRNTLCVLCTLGLGAWMALNNTVSLGTCYSFFVFSFRSVAGSLDGMPGGELRQLLWQRGKHLQLPALQARLWLLFARCRLKCLAVTPFSEPAALPLHWAI